MTGASRERVRAALDHREPDRIPFDMGGSRMTGIHLRAYKGLRVALGLALGDVRVGDLTQQLAEVDTDVMDLLGCDVRVIGPRAAAGYRREMVEADGYVSFRDEWGAGRRMPLDGGMYFDTFGSPLGGEVDAAAIDAFPWPDPHRPRAVRRPRGGARRIVDEEGRASRRLDLRRTLRGPVQDAGVRGRLHGPGGGARPRPARDGARSSRSSLATGTGRWRSSATTWTSSARRTTWRPGPPAVLARDVPGAGEAAPARAVLVHPLADVRQGLLPQLWRDPGAGAGPDRDRRRHPQSRPGVRHRHERRGAQARVRA